MQADELVRLIEARTGRQGRRLGSNVRLLCPAHDDHEPSLDVAASATGEALVRCRSRGCSYEAILAALGVEPGTGSANGNGTWTPFGDALAVYPYHDEAGALLYEICRTRDKAFPLRRLDPTSKSGYRWKAGDVRRVVYRLPEVVAAIERGETVYVVEGEKDADRLRALGFTATCNPGGAGNWRADYADGFDGARVVVVADRDTPGLDHARRVAHSLAHAGATVKLLQPAVEETGADVSDHLDAGLTLDALVSVEPGKALALVEPGPVEDVGFRLPIRTAVEIMAIPDPPESAKLLGQLVFRGYRTIIVGDTGHGKTTLALQMVAGIVRGESVLDQEGAGVGPALVIDLEQGVRSIKRGLSESGLAEREDVLYATIPDGLALDRDEEHFAALDLVLSDYRPVVVLLDPYYKAHRADDPNAERPIIDLMRTLDALRARYGFALILPAHPRKADSMQRGARKLTIHDVAGSGAVTRGAEVVLGIERLTGGGARLRYLKDRDGDLDVGEAVSLAFKRGVGYVIDTAKEDDDAQLRTAIVRSEYDWMTSAQWKDALDDTRAIGRKVGVDRVIRLLTALAHTTERGAEQVAYALGPEGRKENARCWATRPDLVEAWRVSRLAPIATQQQLPIYPNREVPEVREVPEIEPPEMPNREVPEVPEVTPLTATSRPPATPEGGTGGGREVAAGREHLQNRPPGDPDPDGPI